MNEEGKLQKEPALELAKTFLEDAEELKNIEDYLHSCSHSKLLFLITSRLNAKYVPTITIILF